MPWTAKQHSVRKKQPRERKKKSTFYEGRPWRKFRRWFLAENPMCADPFGYHDEDGKDIAAVDVDHIVPMRLASDRAFDESNCQGLCKACHTRKTNRERQQWQHSQ